VGNTIGKRSFQKREESKMLLPPPSSAIAKCYQSEADCKNKTSSCNSRGNCTKYSVEKSRECWACLCALDQVNNTLWGGNACELDDIAVDFHLLFWTSLALFLAVGYTSFYLVGAGNGGLYDSSSGSGGSDHIKSD
jgi:hypothetical protein